MSKSRTKTFNKKRALNMIQHFWGKAIINKSNSLIKAMYINEN